MGRKSKLKKLRKQQTTESKSANSYDSTQFVKQFKKMGYEVIQKQQPKSLDAEEQKISPEIPTEKIYPQL